MDVPQQLHMYGIMCIQIPSMNLLERVVNVNCTSGDKLQAINMAIEYVIILRMHFCRPEVHKFL